VVAATEIYVDPSLDSDSGAGTSGDPYGDLEWALSQASMGAGGSRINIKAGTAEVLSAPLDFTSFGVPNVGTNLQIEGYTSTAGDGGMGEINCGSGTLFTNTFYDHVFLKHTSHVLDVSQGGTVIGNYIYDLGTNLAGAAVLLGNYTRAVFNMLDLSGGKATGFWMEAYTTACFNGVLHKSIATNSASFYCNNVAPLILSNSIFSDGSDEDGIRATQYNTVLMNNIIEGLSGTGGNAVLVSNDSIHPINNRWYNCDTIFSDTPQVDQNNSTLSGSVFADPLNGDLAIDAVLRAAAWAGPNNLLGASGSPTKTFVDMGAAQRQEGAGLTKRMRMIV
jgi:hypothetical protein